MNDRAGPRSTVRMAPIATLPVFFKLGGKRVVVAGGTPPAAWKAELLSAAGAAVEVFAEAFCEALPPLAASPPGGAIRLIPRAWQADDLRGAALALGAMEEAGEAAAFRDAAHRAGVPVNVIDNPPFCDFQFGTIVSRSPLVIGISTDGAAPVFGQALRARIEALLPQGLTAWAEAARDWRPAVQRLGLDFRGRRRFWEVFATRALAGADRAPASDDLAACQAAVAGAGTVEDARLVMVCAGTGEADALTLQAVRALQTADTVFHAADLPPVLVGFARREADKVALTGDAAPSLRAACGPGRVVAWLDRGDPLRCRRWQARERDLHGLAVTLERIPGLGLCPACTPACPAWPTSGA